MMKYNRLIMNKLPFDYVFDYTYFGAYLST